MINTKHMFEFESNTGAATTRAQVIPLPSDSGLRNPERDYNPEYIAAAAAAIGRAGARARTRVYAREELADLADYYCATYDRQRMPPAVQRDMCAALDAGMEPEVLMLAMDDAARIDRPSWTYAMAIIKRCLAEGCRTVQDWERRKAAHAAAYAQRARTVREPYANRTRDVRAPYANGPAQTGKALQDYAQREYHEEDFAVDAVMQMWMEEQGKAPNSAK